MPATVWPSRSLLLGALVTAACLLMAGCPLLDLLRPASFRSADVGLNSSRENFLGAIGAAPELDGNGDDAREVVEPDIFRQQGSILYILNQYRGLQVVDLDTMTLKASLPTTGYPRDLYIAGNRAFVLVSQAENLRIEDGIIAHDFGSRLYIVDIADPAEPFILGTAELDGHIFDSRLVGNILYAVSADYQWYYHGVPGVVDGGIAKQQVGETFVTSFDVSVPGAVQVRDQLAFDTPGELIHVTPDALFVASWQGDGTAIRYVDISDPNGALHTRGSVLIQGQVADRFKMDAFEGHLRVVSHQWAWPDSQIFVTTVPLSTPDNLVVLAQTEFETARGDQLFATRFDGPRAYVVTYFVIDPLYVVDLSDPAKPVIEGELSVPGWSTHIEPRGDRLIALGVDDQNGWRASVSLFDVSDPAAPGLIQRVTFGEGWSWSSAQSDVKAFSVVGDRILVPFSGWNEGGGYDRLQFLSWNENGLEKQGFVDVEGAVLRSFDHAGSVFSMTSTQLASINAGDPNNPVITGALPLAENVVDVLQTANGALARVVAPFSGESVAVAIEGGGSVQAAVGAFEAAHVHGNKVVVVGASYEGTPHYRVAFVDATNPAAPVLDKVLGVPIEPASSYWWWGPGLGMPEVFVRNKLSIAGPWWPWWGGRRSFLTGEHLSLRGFSTQWTHLIGDGNAQEGLAVVNLDSQTVARTIGLGYERIDTIDEGGDRLFLGTAQGESNLLGRPMVAYYLRTINPATGQAGNAANVPGSFVQYDSARGLLLLQDYQWSSGYNIERSLRTMAWNNGSQPRLLDSLRVPDAAMQTVAAGNRAYFDLQDDRGYSIQPVSIASNGNLSESAAVIVSKGYGWLLGADETDAIARVGSQGIARYDFTESTPLRELQAVMGWPSNARWTPTQVLIPLGYSGYVAMER